MRIRSLIIDDEELARLRIRDLLDLHPSIEVVGECGDGASAIDRILALRPDLLFLDIQMPERGGFEVLQAVAREILPATIFVTAYDEYALRAFEAHALDYLLKPIDPTRFHQAVSRAVKIARGDPVPGLLTLLENLGAPNERRKKVGRRGTQSVFFDLDEITWCEAAGNYVRVRTPDGECLVRETLTSLIGQLDPRRFARVHRSILVNLERIATLTPKAHGEYEILMRDGKVLQSSRTYRESLRAHRRGIR